MYRHVITHDWHHPGVECVGGKTSAKIIYHVKGNEEDKEKCEVESCGEWMPWAEWSQCLSIPQNYPGLRLNDLPWC